MKKLTLLLIILIVCTCFCSCQYDKTDAFRACFSYPHAYEGTLLTDDELYSVRLHLPEDGNLSLIFTDGKLKGLEKRFSDEGETDVYAGMEFALPRNTDFYALYQAFVFLSQQHYPCTYRDTEQSFEFVQEAGQIRVGFDPKNEQLLRLELSDARKHLTLQITDVKKE